MFVSQNKIYDSSISILRTPPRRNPLQWAEEKRELPPWSAEPGKFRASRTPYLVPIAEAFIDPKYSRIILVCASQSAKTEFLINCCGYRMDESPVPAIFVCPTQKLTESASGRVSQMVKSVPSLHEKLAKGQRDKISEKFFAGVRLGFAWSSSANELSSHPAGLVIMDERDRMENDVQGEGDPVEICQGRTATYPDAKMIITSTPTIEGASPIWDLWEEGTRFRWSIPCPRCNDFFVPSLKIFKWKLDENALQKSLEEDEERKESQNFVEEAFLECPKCNEKIQDNWRLKMNAEGKYESDYREASEYERNTTGSWWVSGLCSPWRNYLESASLFIRATRSKKIGRIQATVNIVFGETWKIKGEKPSFEQIFSLCCDLEFGKLPERVLCLTCGVDVQKHSLYYAIRAWGFRGESWTVEYGQLFALHKTTEDGQVWGDLQEGILDKEWKVEGGSYKIRLCAIDSSFNSPTVHFFCQTSPRVTIPIRGKETLTTPIKSSKVELNYKGKYIPGGVTLFWMDDGYFKDLLHSKIRRGNATGAESWHIPKDVSEEFCKQILSEELVTLSTGGKKWAKTHENHWLDCEKQNEACGFILGTTRFRESKQGEIEGDMEKSQYKTLSRGLKNDG